ncbi:2-dehydropantoate 2-reductase [Peribacillus alkalitolerans]|uniref:2-dehydropantoate 2-reductase n=1 Tax=Peribacillus alkalitolerans TaxID=1550385 RepID=UPI0013D126A3|nr:2-dehydropantoate 2-reductase [Peribacillus alkalitolerans]
MNIGIIGGGAIGLLFGFYLSSEHAITIFTKTEHQAKEINEDGIHCLIEDVRKIAKVNACNLEDKGLISEQDLLIITVKQYQLEVVLPYLKNIKSQLIFIQNGMAHLDQIKHLKADIFLGTVEHGALKVDNHTVHHTGHGSVKMAAFQGDISSISFLSRIEKFPIYFQDHYLPMLLDKLLVNACVNPLTAILEVKNGELMTNSHFHHILTSLCKELCTVFEISDWKQVLGHIEYVCRNTSSNSSSMLKDIENQRQTEIDAILGYVLAEAKKRNHLALLSESLYNMVKGKELQSGKGK